MPAAAMMGDTPYQGKRRERNLRPGFWLCVALGAAAGCRDTAADTLDAPGHAPAASVASSPPRSITTIDDEFAKLSDVIPGFGGLYYDAVGRLTVVMKSPDEYPAHRIELAQFIRKMRPSDPRVGQTAEAEVDGANILTGRYSSRELLAVYRGALLQALPDVGGLVSTDIDETRNLISIGVNSDDAIGPARDRLLAAGVPQDMLAFHTETLPRPNSLLTDSLRPVPGGAYITIINPSNAASVYCTLGYNLLRYMGFITDTVATARYFVTASHCTPTQWGVDNSNARQPFTYFAVEVADYSGFTGAPCMSGKICRYADASIFQYYNPAVIGPDDGHVALPSTVGSLSFSFEATVTHSDMPTVGMGLAMVGATSGRHNGTVVASCVDIWGAFSSHTNFELLCQGKGSYSAIDGDSGAPVLTLYADGASATGIGIMTITQSGSTYAYFSPMQSVISEAYDDYPSLRQLQPVVY